MGFSDRLKHAWNVFKNGDQEETVRSQTGNYEVSYGNVRPHAPFASHTNERSIVASILTRISMDVAAINLRHVKKDENDRYKEDIQSGLNYCLTQRANIDQPARTFRQDICYTLLDEGVIAIVPIETTINPITTGGYDIKTMRVGTIVNWLPYHVRVSLYNEKKGKREELTLPKSHVAVVENPLYAVMNQPNSTLKRLVSKLGLMDVVDDKVASGKLDIIIQLPYAIRSEARREQASQRRKDLEFQLKGSQYGIAYSDATEKITQLNRPAENNLMGQVEFLTKMLYGQLGITDEVINGTADESTMLNYFNRTVEPIVTAITESISTTFLTKTARTQRQWVMFFNDLFKLVPMETIADIADKLTRNEIASANELRTVIGLKPSTDPKADELRNSNMPTETDPGQQESGEPTPT